MMTASVAMGVCVDDTVHFANWFRRATRLGLNHRDAAVLAFENSAGAIYQSTVIVALGLVTFALSSFMPTRRFGLLDVHAIGLRPGGRPGAHAGDALGNGSADSSRWVACGARRVATTDEAELQPAETADRDFYAA